MTPGEAYGALTLLGRLTEALTQVEAQRDQALAKVKELEARLAEADEAQH